MINSKKQISIAERNLAMNRWNELVDEGVLGINYKHKDKILV